MRDFFLKQDPATVYARIRDELSHLAGEITGYAHTVDIRPETTGKRSQFGSLDELLNLAAEIPDVGLCIDWSHLHARDGGCNKPAEFQHVLDRIRKRLGDLAISDMHMHLSGIAFGPKGERNHLNIEESDMNWRDLLRVFKDNDVRGILICESPSIEDDARRMKDFYFSL